MAQLFKTNEEVFHMKDLAILWNITDNNALRTTVKRYVQRGLIYRIYKGMYSVLPLEKLDSVLLGKKAIHGYIYLSTESILFREGYISRKIEAVTFVSGKSRRFFLGDTSYISRQLKLEFLYNPTGLMEKDNILQADIYRAIADMLYFNAKFHFDRTIDWPKVKAIQQEIGYPLTPLRYVNS